MFFAILSYKIMTINSLQSSCGSRECTYDASCGESLAGSQMELEGSRNNTIIETLSILLNSVQIPPPS